MRDVTLTDVELIGAFGDADRTFLMTEEAFHAFYEQTARPVWAYLARITGDGRLADDLLQEAYSRFLRTRADFESDDHRRNYLFRIATNLARDYRRRRGTKSDVCLMNHRFRTCRGTRTRATAQCAGSISLARWTR